MRISDWSSDVCSSDLVREKVLNSVRVPWQFRGLFGAFIQGQRIAVGGEEGPRSFLESNVLERHEWPMQDGRKGRPVGMTITVMGQLGLEQHLQALSLRGAVFKIFLYSHIGICLRLRF